MRRRCGWSWSVAALAAVVTILAAGCGDDDDDADDASDGSLGAFTDEELANALLDVDDLPTGWATSPPDDDESDSDDESGVCGIDNIGDQLGFDTDDYPEAEVDSRRTRTSDRS